MGQRARYSVVACIALAVLAGGCNRGTVRPGQRGDLVTLASATGVSTGPILKLNGAGATGFPRSGPPAALSPYAPGGR